jgi:hypothetical protein
MLPFVCVCAVCAFVLWFACCAVQRARCDPAFWRLRLVHAGQAARGPRPFSCARARACTPFPTLTVTHTLSHCASFLPRTCLLVLLGVCTFNNPPPLTHTYAHAQRSHPPRSTCLLQGGSAGGTPSSAAAGGAGAGAAATPAKPRDDDLPDSSAFGATPAGGVERRGEEGDEDYDFDFEEFNPCVHACAGSWVCHRGCARVGVRSAGARLVSVALHGCVLDHAAPHHVYRRPREKPCVPPWCWCR